MKSLNLVLSLIFYVSATLAYSFPTEPAAPQPIAVQSSDTAACDPYPVPCWVAADPSNPRTQGLGPGQLETLQTVYGEEIPVSFDITGLDPTPKTLGQFLYGCNHGRQDKDIGVPNDNIIEGWPAGNLKILNDAQGTRIFDLENGTSVLVAVVATADSAVTAVADAPVQTASYVQADVEAIRALANDLKAKYNAMVTLTNELKTQFNLSNAP